MASTTASTSASDDNGTTNSSESDVILTLPPNITVRRYRPSDAESIAKHASNLAVWNNLTDRMPYPYTVSDADFWISHSNDPSTFLVSGHYDSTPISPTADIGASGPALPLNYTICVDDSAVGSIGLETNSGVYRRTATLGYWLSETYWGQGVMGKVVPAFVDWCWRTFGVLVRINGSTYEANIGSQKILQKAGFVYEGRRQDYYVKNGVVGAELMWGALKPERYR